MNIHTNYITSVGIKFQVAIVALFFLLFSPISFSQTSAEQSQQYQDSQQSSEQQASKQDVDQNLQALKSDVVGIAADMKILEEQMLYPEAEQVAVFLSVHVGNSFTLSSVKIVLNDEEVTNRVYAANQLDALERGGIERLFLGDIDVGEHTVTAFFSGLDHRGRKIKRGVTRTFTKAAHANAIELNIKYNGSQPKFSVVEL